MSSCSAIRWARSGFDLPENSMSRFCGASAIARPTSSSGWGVIPSSPGSVCSIVPLSTAPFLVLLLRPGNGQGARRHILCDDGAGCNPCVVADGHGGDERIVDARPDVASDRGALLGARVLLIGRDVPSGDVRILADVRVAEVREVGYLRAFADTRVLELDEGSGLRARLEHGAWTQVAERPHEGVLPHRRIDDDRVRADLGMRG